MKDIEIFFVGIIAIAVLIIGAYFLGADYDRIAIIKDQKVCITNTIDTQQVEKCFKLVPIEENKSKAYNAASKHF